jgi:5-methylthioadenosine/S-adenosylhomocysteine deaminase
MATRDAARILKWDKVLGAIEAGKRADVLILAGTTGDPYDAIIHAGETDLQLVMINGVARYGVTGVMQQLSPGGETIRVGGQSRKVFLKQETEDPDVAAVPLAKATSALTIALHDIAKLAKELEKAKPVRAARRMLDAHVTPVWSLALDEISPCGVEMAPRLPFDGPADFTGPDRAPRAMATTAPPLSTILNPVALDPLTVADDATFLQRIAQQPNVPAALRAGLAALY